MRPGSVFELIGRSENSITYSLGWALSRSPGLIEAIAKRLGASAGDFDQIRLQEYGEDGGYTVIELLGPKHHIIIEAKRGWWLPGGSQFARYVRRFEREGRLCRRFVAMSDCTEEHPAETAARFHKPSRIDHHLLLVEANETEATSDVATLQQTMRREL